MKNKLPSKVWVLEDQKDAIQLINRYFGTKSESILDIETNAKEVKKWFKGLDAPPDVMLLDICLKPWEERIIIAPKKNFQKLSELTEVSGIKFLTWLRCEWPRLPVLFMSGYWNRIQVHNPKLSQHALCLIPKPLQPSLTNFLWCAQQVIIGLLLPKNLVEAAREILDEVHEVQNHFYFVLCETEKKLVSPPPFLEIENELQLNLLFEVWNNRVLGLMEDESTMEGGNSFHPILPFSRVPLARFSIRLSKEVDYMGLEYLAPYLLRECARTAYLLFFNIQPHQVDTGQCIFDNSTYAPDLLPGIMRPDGICPQCFNQLVPSHANGGWSKGRDAAVNEILRLARKKLKDID